MRFYTPDLYRRTQSEDEAVLNAADAEWYRTNEDYDRHLKAIHHRFTPGMRELDELLLHDAAIKSLARRDGRLVMVLHKDIPPRDLVFLDYDLASEPVFEPYYGPQSGWDNPAHFLFDELDVDPGEPAVFTEGIVFSNGWLLRLRFRDVRVTLAQPLPLPSAELARTA